MTLKSGENKGGGLKETFVGEIEAREYAEFIDQRSGLLFRLTHASGMAGDYQPGENRTVNYRPGAAILTISVIGADIVEDGSIGGLKIGSSEAEVHALAKGKPSKGEDVIWEFLDNAVQEWTFPESGLTLDMVSEQVGGTKTVFSITVEAPSELKTGHGIGIGAAKIETSSTRTPISIPIRMNRKMFRGDRDAYLVGSIYGGMAFTFNDVKVSGIFLGAMDE